MKISVIVPTYNCSTRTVNGELCIIKLVESLCKQTLKNSDYEVIFVDDCSKDNTIEIIHENYNNPNYQVYKLQKNSGGASMPRNKGIELANGEFIFFVDSDDYLDTSALESMYEFAEKNESDYVVPKFVGVNRGAAKNIFENNNVADADPIKNNVLSTLSVFRLFKTSIIKDNGLRFPEDYKQHEDFYFSLSYLAKKPKISILADKVYYYWVMTDGENLSQSGISVDDFFRYQDEILSFLNGEDYLSLLKSRYIVRIMDLHLVKQLLNKDISGNISEDIMNNYKFLELKRLLNKHCDDEITILLPLKYRLLVDEIKEKGIEDVLFLNKALQHYESRKNYVTVVNDQIGTKIYSFKEKVKYSYNLVLKYGIVDLEIEKFEVKNLKLLVKGKLKSNSSDQPVYELVFKERGTEKIVSFLSDSLSFNVDLKEFTGNQKSYWDIYIECNDGTVKRGSSIVSIKGNIEVMDKRNEIIGELFKNWKNMYSLKININTNVV